MTTTRLEAFSDAVIAIIITIMVLELKVPHSADPQELLALWPVLISYVLSFLALAIYWVNHHRILHIAKRADNAVLWCNNLLLFWLSLFPFATAYMGENHFATFPTALYAALSLVCGLSYLALWSAIARHHRHEPEFLALNRAAKRKNFTALAIFVIAIPLAYVHPAITVILCYVVAALYFIPEMWLEEGERMCGLK